MRRLSLWPGILALFIGIFLFVHSFATTTMIGWIIALLVFMSGITSLSMYTNSVEQSFWYLLQSILSIIFGTILLSSSTISLSSAITTIAAYWTLTSSILRLTDGFQMCRAGFHDANRLLSFAVLTIPLGLFPLFNPIFSAVFIGHLTGLLLIAVSVSGVAFSFRI